jgi:hypothetical protein
MAVKLLSEQRVDDAAYGVYSHRLGGWIWCLQLQHIVAAHELFLLVSHT